MPDSPFVAQIMPATFNFAPTGWATCDGQLMPISQNTALFSLLGTQYGGDGRVTYALPNLQNSVALGRGQSDFGSEYYIGHEGGELAVTLQTTEIPSHSHSVPATDQLGRGRVALSGVPAASMSGSSVYSVPGSLQSLSPFSVGVTGGGQPHSNLQPYATLLFVIALQGVFPARN